MAIKNGTNNSTKKDRREEDLKALLKPQQAPFQTPGTNAKLEADLMDIYREPQRVKNLDTFREDVNRQGAGYMDTRYGVTSAYRDALKQQQAQQAGNGTAMGAYQNVFKNNNVTVTPNSFGSYWDKYQNAINSGAFDDGDDYTKWSPKKVDDRIKELQEEIANITNLQTSATPEERKAKQFELDNLWRQKGAYTALDMGDAGLWNRNLGGEVKKRPADYATDDTIRAEYDRTLYDQIHGDGSYEQRVESLKTDADVDRFDREMDDLWNRFENRTLYQIPEQDTKLQQQEKELNNFFFGTEEQEKELKRLQKWQENRENIGKYEAGAAGLTVPEDWKAPEQNYLTGGNNRGQQLLNIMTGPQGEKKVDKIWREMSQERSAWGRLTFEEQNNVLQALGRGESIDLSGGGADDLFGAVGRHYIYMTDDQVATFENYYKNGMEDEALAYMDALEQYYLQPAQTMYQQMVARQEAEGPNGWMYGATSILTRPFDSMMGMIGTGLALAGNEDASNANSGWYRGQAINDAIRGGRTEAWGQTAEDLLGEWARKPAEFLNGVFYSMADMTMAAATGQTAAGAGTQGANILTQFIMSSEAASSTMREQLEQHRDPTEAALRSIGAGAIEWITEKYSIEQLLNPNVKEMLRSKKGLASFIAKNTIAEGTEEGASDVLNIALDVLLSGVYGHEDEITAAYNNYRKQGMTDDEATRAVLWDNLSQIGLDMLAGSVSGFLMSGSRVGMNAVGMKSEGRNIKSGSNVTAEGVTGIDQVLQLSLGMKEGTQSRALAEEIQKKIDSGKAPTDFEMGRLAQLTAVEAGEQQEALVRDSVERTIRESITKQGVPAQEAAQYSAIITGSLMEGKSLTKEQMSVLSQSEPAMNVWKSYNTRTGATALGMEARKAAAPSQSIINRLGDLTGQTNYGNSVIAAEIVRSSRETNSPAEAIDNLAQRRSDLMSEDFAKVAKEVLQSDKKIVNKARFLDDAMKIRLAAMTLNDNLPANGMSAESAQKLYDAARAEFDAIDEQRIRQQVQVKPGEGWAKFNGAEYGTAAFDEAIAGQNRQLRNQMRMIGEVATRMGSRVTFINDEDNPGIFGYEQSDGSITVNIAGRHRSGMSHHMMVTLSHEMTHWLEQNSREGYNQLRKFVLDSLRAKGTNIEQLIVSSIDNQNAVLGADSGESLTINGAMAEIVARSCENLLSSQAMADELAKTNPSLYSKVKSFVKNFVARMREAVKGMNSSLSYEARALLNETEKIARIWLGAREEALGRETTEGTEDISSEVLTSYSTEQLSEVLASYTMDQLDDAYMNAVEEGNEELLNAMVQEAARRNGYTTPKLHHGTREFGFTEFDLSQGSGMIFSTSDRGIAETYSGETKRTRISERSKLDVSSLNGEDLLKETQKHIKKYREFKLLTQEEREEALRDSQEDIRRNARDIEDFINQNRDSFTDFKYEKAMDIVQSLMDVADSKTTEDSFKAWNKYEAELWSFKWEDENLLWEMLPDERSQAIYLAHKNFSDFMREGSMYARESYKDGYVFDSQLKLELRAELHKGVYELYGNPGKQLEIEGNGSNWNDITAPDELMLYGPQRTRDIATAAYAKGYDSVLLKSIRDSGGETAYNKASDVYIFFDANRLKSADPVTYDDQGEVIKLSERFNTENPDIRYSTEQLDAEYQAAVESGDLQRATDMLMDRMAETEGIIPFNAPHGYGGQHKDIAKLIKEGTPEAVARAAADMARFVPENGVLIPMPPHEGTVKADTDTMILANAIGKLTGRPVVVALASDPRESRYKAKSEGRKGVSAAEMGFRQVEEIPEGSMPIFVDNVVGSGVTADAARTALGGGITLAYAKGTQSKGIEGLKRATVTYDRDGKLIPLSQRFDRSIRNVNYSVAQEAAEQARNGAHPESAEFSVEQISEATGLRLDPITLQLFDAEGNEIDGVEHKITPNMIENSPVAILINMARDGAKTKAGKVKFKPTIDEKTARAQKKMFADLMNMVARYKDSNLVWEIASSTLFSALKENSDPQYSTTIDFGTVCAKTQEIINVMSRVMLEKQRGLTREEVLMVYNETAKANLTVPCPVCYVFSRWMGVPSLLNQMSQYQDRFVKLNEDKTIDVKATQKAATDYIREALNKYENKEGIDKAKTSLMNRMKTQEKRRTEALNVMLSETATKEEKREAKEKHDIAIAEMDRLSNDLGEVEAYNWVTQALCKETKEGSGNYVVDPEFELTPKDVLFDLRRTGEFAKYKKNWRYRNTRGAGMGKAIMPYSGMTIGDVIFGTDRKAQGKNPFLNKTLGKASDGIKNAIARIRKQNLIGGQRLQSTSDFRPEWGLDYIMAFLELQAIGSKVQMYTKVAEAVDFLASMGGDINLSIMGSGSGYHVATAEDYRKAKKDKDLASRMITLDNETYVMDFSDVTGMAYNTAKELKERHSNVQAILVGMNDIHVKLAMLNPDIDFIIPWHSSGNTKDALSSMIESVGERLETSSDYTDTQSDAASANQTPEQKRLWELRMKILTKGRITEKDLQEIRKDSKYLSKLYDRFYEEGVDPDCYQVKLGTDQAKQIFPYEYWDKSSTKAKADVNGKRFVEYCRHFGMVPRFSGVVKKNDDGTFTVTGNFAGAVYNDDGEIVDYDENAMAKGYWKVLIDRPMYDNNGKYREQEVVDVTKAKIGSLNEKGELEGSDLPLKTSAMYGPNYSEREKRATDNTLAAIEERANIAGITEQMLEEDEEGAEEAEEEGRQYSMEDAPDMDVNAWMAGLTPGSLQTEDERALHQAWKDLRMSFSLSIKRQLDYRAKIKRLESLTNPTKEERADLIALRNRLQDQEENQARLEKKIAEVTSREGFAGMMYEHNMRLKDTIAGRTQDEVNNTVEDMVHEVQKMAQEIAEAKRELEKIAEQEGVKQAEAFLKKTQLGEYAKSLKKDYRSRMTEGEIRSRMAEMALRIAQGETVDDILDSASELAYDLARMQTGYQGAYGDAAERLKKATIVIGQTQYEQLRAQHSSIPELRRQLAGTGVKIVYDKNLRGAGTLEDIGPGSEIHNLLPELGDDTGNMMDNLDKFLSVARSIRENIEKEMIHDFDLKDATDMIRGFAMLGAAEMKGNPAMATHIRRLLGLQKADGGKAGELAERLANAQAYMGNALEKGDIAKGLTRMLKKDVDSAIDYYNKIAAVAAKEEKRKVREGLIKQLKSEHGQALLREQMKWRDLIEKDKTVREKMASNHKLRQWITTDYSRIRKLLINETDQKNIPEHMKSLARQMLKMLTENDMIGRKITEVERADLKETLRVLGAMKETDAEFTIDDLKAINDEEVQAAVAEALADLEDGIKFYNASPGSDRISNLQAFHNALDRIHGAVDTIYSVIKAQQSISFMDRQILVADAAEDIRRDMEKSRFKGELKGRGSKAIRTVKNAVVYGNMTPVYFIKNLLNRGMDEQWKEIERGENQYGLEEKKAENYVADLAARTGYSSWSNQKLKVTLGGNTKTISIENAMELYAIWRREQTTNPEMSQHLTKGGVVINEEEETGGKLQREHKEMRPIRVTDGEILAMYDQLTDEQKAYIEGMVKYLSNDMSELGNAASMRMYGIKKYKEKYYFPMKVWDGVKSARSDKGISGTDENRAAHKSWSKRRQNMARNALVIGNFTQDAVNHIVEMITYNTMAPAIENLNRVLNFQFTEGMTEDDITKRNLRIMFAENYGKDALNYLETFMKDLNGGAVQDQRKTLRDRMLAIFKKNAVAGSLSVALQQPLSYVRAAMMINPKYLAQALNPKYWKGSHEEMTKYSGVAVIKDMGRFDMNFGQSAVDSIMPEGAKTKGRAAYEWLSDKTTMLPEMMDRMTWTRMWSAVKAEQAAQNPGMDVKSDEFLQKCAERFNDVMRKTQVYDSVLVKSSNMRSQNLGMKVMTSFMAEPTLTLNVLADAVRNVKLPGGKAVLAKAGATYVLSAVFQALVKAAMGTGRSPDKKKTIEENILNKFMQSFMGEVNPMSLIPGYSDLIEVLKTGELQDDAMGALGKLFSVVETTQKAIQGKGSGAYRDIEDTVGQLAQLFTNIPAKNLMRDARAMWNWAVVRPYADRATSGAVLKEQSMANFMTGDNLLGVLNKWLGEAGYQTTNASYYDRMMQAREAGDAEREDELHEYLTLARGVTDKTISQEMRKRMKASSVLTPEEKIKQLREDGMKDTDIAGWIVDEYEAGNLTKTEAEKLYVQANPKKDANDAYFMFERKEQEKETGESVTGGDYYKLDAAIAKGDTEAATAAAKDLTAHGYTSEDVNDHAKDYITKKYRAGEITNAQAKQALKTFRKDLDDVEIFWMLDRIDYKNETGKSAGSGKYYRLDAAIEANKAAEITRAVNDMLKYGGYDKEGVLKGIRYFKKTYLAAEGNEKIKLRDALTKAFKATGMSATEATKEIDSWKPAKTKKKTGK